MNKKWIAIVIALAVISFWVIQEGQKWLEKSDPKDKTSVSKVEGSSYWTCPMHPQIHSAHPGECPICHMKLVQVKEQVQEKKIPEEKRTSVQTTSQQLELLGIQKQEVEKMTLLVRIPISGRVLSSSSVAFQVYEKDLRYIHRGLNFKGQGSIYSEEEISGVVTSIDSIVDPTSRTVRVVGSIRKGPHGLIAETSFRGEIEIELKDKIAISASSVLHTGQGDLVYILEGKNLFAPKKVQLGLKTESFYEVISGLNAGDIISSGPNFLMDSEAKIRGANN